MPSFIGFQNLETNAKDVKELFIKFSFLENHFNSKKWYRIFNKNFMSVVIQIIHMAAVSVGCHTNNPYIISHYWKWFHGKQNLM